MSLRSGGLARPGKSPTAYSSWRQTRLHSLQVRRSSWTAAPQQWHEQALDARFEGSMDDDLYRICESQARSLAGRASRQFWDPLTGTGLLSTHKTGWY